MSPGGVHDGIPNLMPAIRKGQCTCNVTFWGVRIIIFALTKQQRVLSNVEPYVAVSTVVAFIASVDMEGHSKFTFLNCRASCWCQQCFYGNFMSPVRIISIELFTQNA